VSDSSNTLLLRADASAKIGYGHVMRCLALAQAWQDRGGRAVFACTALPEALQSRLKRENMELHHMSSPPGGKDDATETATAARRYGSSWIVVDGYHFGGDYQQAVKQLGARLLFIDDNGHAEHYAADLVLNQNPHAQADLYRSREAHVGLLLGTEYVLLRREFRTIESRPFGDRNAARILVTLGGTDPRGWTEAVVERLAAIAAPGMEIVVVGKRPPMAIGGVAGNANIRVEPDPPDMARLMVGADLAVAAAGSVCWELAYLGVPMVLLAVAQNQRPVAAWLAELDVALGAWDEVPVDFGDKIACLLRDPHRRQAAAQRGRQLVDGRGPERVLAAMEA
jgi:UDP-2,4-diacetamido-2,4,6-trideoxy-beta-L-altropyranose hydrolase